MELRRIYARKIRASVSVGVKNVKAWGDMIMTAQQGKHDRLLMEIMNVSYDKTRYLHDTVGSLSDAAEAMVPTS